MRLQNAPLVQVLAQVVFTTVPDMSERVRALHARLNTLYPRYHEDQTVMAGISVQPGADVQVLPPKTTTRWIFADRARQTGVIVTETGVLLHTTSYGGHRPFFARLGDVLRALDGSLSSKPMVERVGLRYVDLVRPEHHESYGTYVHQGLLGFPFRDASQLSAVGGGFLTQSVAETPNGVLAIRSMTLPAGTYLPPDLESGLLAPLDLPAVEGGRPGLAVDFDHFTLFTGAANTMDFVPDAILAHFGTLHGTLREAFQVIITSDARAAWGPPVDEDVEVRA